MPAVLSKFADAKACPLVEEFNCMSIRQRAALAISWARKNKMFSKGGAVRCTLDPQQMAEGDIIASY